MKLEANNASSMQGTQYESDTQSCPCCPKILPRRKRRWDKDLRPKETAYGLVIR